MNDIRYCVNGCTRKGSDGNRHPKHADTGNLCANCTDRLHTWLYEIPDRYATIPSYIDPATGRDPDPNQTQHIKRTNAPIPVRLDVIDLLDTRRGRKWQGLVPTTDRRGTLGTLLPIGNTIRERHGSQPKLDSTVVAEADHIRKNINALAHIDYVDELYTEIRKLHRALGEAIGIHPHPPVATCTIVDPERELAEGEPPECGGPIFPARNSAGAYCARCHTEWKPDELAHLGAILKVDAS